MRRKKCWFLHYMPPYIYMDIYGYLQHTARAPLRHVGYCSIKVWLTYKPLFIYGCVDPNLCFSIQYTSLKILRKQTS